MKVKELKKFLDQFNDDDKVEIIDLPKAQHLKIY